MSRFTEDLRFFIGAFFLIVGTLLCIQGLRVEVLVEGYNLNLVTGVVFVLFAAFALAMSLRQKQK